MTRKSSIHFSPNHSLSGQAQPRAKESVITPSPKDLEDFYASRNVLAANIEMFHRGHRDLYRVVAVELRKLLCDGKQSLVARLSPAATMHPIVGELPPWMKEGLVFHIPSTICSDGKGGLRVTELFDLKAPMLPLSDWLAQEIFSQKITIRELIRSVADKESAHSDREYNDTLQFSRSLKVFNEEIHKHHIVAIGEYVLAFMKGTITRYPKLFERFGR